jgi:hypothetical protein
MNLIEKLKTRWGITSTSQVMVILLVFALTGTSAVYIRRPVFQWLGITHESPFWFRALIWLLTVFPAYNALLLGYGWLLGQFAFFWNFEKKCWGRFLPKKPSRKGIDNKA